MWDRTDTFFPPRYELATMRDPDRVYPPGSFLSNDSTDGT
jgi:hypothetical protein